MVFQTLVNNVFPFSVYAYHTKAINGKWELYKNPTYLLNKLIINIKFKAITILQRT